MARHAERADVDGRLEGKVGGAVITGDSDGADYAGTADKMVRQLLKYAHA